MNISPLSANRNLFLKNKCINYNNISFEKKFPKSQKSTENNSKAQMKELSEKAFSTRRGQEILHAAYIEMQRAGGVLEADCYHEFRDVYDAEDVRIRRQYSNTDSPDKKILMEYHPRYFKHVVFDPSDLAIFSVEVTDTKTKKKTSYYFNEHLCLEKAVINEKKPLLGSKTNADEVVIYNSDSSLKDYYQKAKINKDGTIDSSKKHVFWRE